MARRTYRMKRLIVCRRGKTEQVVWRQKHDNCFFFFLCAICEISDVCREVQVMEMYIDKMLEYADK